MCRHTNTKGEREINIENTSRKFMIGDRSGAF